MREGSLAGIVILSCLLFGAVEPWSMAIVSICIVSAFISFVMRAERDDFAFTGAKGLMIPMILLLLYPFFQLLPLPVAPLGLLHARFAEVVTLSPQTVPVFHSVSLYPFATEMDLARLLLYGMVFALAAFGTGEREGAYRIMKVLAVFGFVVALFGIIQHAAGNGKIYWFRELNMGGTPYGPFVNKNHFAGFVGTIIPLSLGVAFRSRKMERKLLFGFFAVVMAISLFFSLSRGGIISFFGALLVFSFVSFTRDMSKKKLIPVFLFVLVLSVYLLSLGISPVIERFARTDVTGEQRLAVWQGTLSAIRDFPVFGSGMGTFQYVFRLYQPDGLRAYFDHAHNDYLEFLLEAGVVGGLIAAAFFFFLFRIVAKAEWRGRDIYLCAAFFASITAVAIHSIVDFNLHIPSNAILFSLVLGLAAAHARRSES